MKTTADVRTHEYFARAEERHGAANVSWRQYAAWMIINDPASLLLAPGKVLRALTSRQAICILLRHRTSFDALETVMDAFGGTEADLITSLQSLSNQIVPPSNILFTVPAKLLSSTNDGRLLPLWLLYSDPHNVVYQKAYRHALNIFSFDAKTKTNTSLKTNADTMLSTWAWHIVLCVFMFGVYVGVVLFALRYL